MLHPCQRSAVLTKPIASTPNVSVVESLTPNGRTLSQVLQAERDAVQQQLLRLQAAHDDAQAQWTRREQGNDFSASGGDQHALRDPVCCRAVSLSLFRVSFPQPE